jgi:hypothetical protein
LIEMKEQFAFGSLDNARLEMWIEEGRWPGFRVALVKLAAMQLIDWQGSRDPAHLAAAQRCLSAAQGHAYPNRNLPAPQPLEPSESVFHDHEY